MKKLGFSKKNNGDPPSGRDALFGNRQPSSNNPYAANAADGDPYMSGNVGPSPPPPYSGGGDRFRNEKTPVPQGGYGSGGDRFGGGPPQNDRYGGGPPQNDRYGGGAPQNDRYGGSGDRYDGHPLNGANKYGGPPQDGNRYGGGPPQGGDNRFGARPQGGDDRSGGPPQAVDNRFGAPPRGQDNRFGAPPRGQDNRSAAPAAGQDNRFGAPPGGNRFGAPPSNGDRYGAGDYGNSGGFGQDRYGDSGSQGGSRYGTGGYGNFSGNSGPPQNSAARDQLFAGARPNAGPDMSSSGSGVAPASANDWNSGRGPGYGSASGGSYGAYEERQLTAEEQEEEDVQATKQEIKFIKQQDVSSTRNAVRILAMAEETGRQTLERLGAQGESIHNTERNLDLASNQNKLAAEKARELKTLNRSMFAVHVANPFTSTKRIKEREQRVLTEAERDRDQRETVRKANWDASSRQQDVANQLGKLKIGGGSNKANLSERAKYQFEADSDDDAMEDEINGNLSILEQGMGRIKTVAVALGNEVESQNKHLDRIGGKVDTVDDEIALNKSRLDRFK